MLWRTKKIDSKVLDQIQKYSPLRVLIYWAVFALLAGACVSVITTEVQEGNVFDQDCVFSEFSPWQGCESLDCSALAYRSRTVLVNQSGDGAPCALGAVLLETTTCQSLLTQCDAVSCQYSEFSDWSACPDTCIVSPTDCAGLGTRVRTRTVIRPAMPGGAQCDWTSLIQTSTCPNPFFCSLTRECLPSKYADDYSQCTGCPLLGCTFTDTPFWTLCTTSNSLGPNSDCNPGQLVYSRTCFYPDCKDTCQNNNYTYFSRCSAPCGPGTYVSSTGQQCPDVSISSCNLGECSPGGMISVSTSLQTTTAPTVQICSSTQDGLSLSRCLAQCASSQTCNYAWQAVVDGNVTLSSSLPLQGDLIAYLWSYSSASTECVPPNWDMAAAACLYICDSQKSSIGLSQHLEQPFNEERGLVFPFGNLQQSCPIKTSVLSQVCPNNTQDLTAVGGVGRAPYLMQNYFSSSENTVVYNSIEYTCPASTDCLYQSWSEAEPWGVCSQGPHNLDTGIRTRIRRVVKAPTFLGQACDIADMTDQFACNRPTALCSSTQMWVYPEPMGANVLTNTSEYACHVLCSESRAEFGADACNSIFTYNTPYTGIAEVFLVSTSALLESTQVAAYSVPGFRVAYASEVQQAWASGMQVCQEGWALSILQDPTSPPLILAAAQQTECSIYAPNSLSILPIVPMQYIFMVGSKGSFPAVDASNNPVMAMPFFMPTASPSLWDPTYLFTTQQYSSDVNCAFYEDRTDRLINAGQCTSLSAQYTHTGATSSLLDMPYSFSRNCEVTPWISDSICGDNCVLDSISTRQYTQGPSQGGLPCSRLALFTQSACPGAVCEEQFPNLCVPSSLSQTSQYITSCSSPDFEASVFFEAFNSQTLWNWAYLALTYNLDIPTLFSQTLVTTPAGQPLDTLLIEALNSQCTFTCIRPVGSTNYYSLTAQGWATVPLCTTITSEQQCVTGAGASPSPGKYLYSSSWTCPSTCRINGLSLSCAFGQGAVPPCPCINAWETTPAPFTVILPYRSASNFTCNAMQQHWTFGCTSTDSEACTQEPNCPVGQDGTQCNSFSGSGTCNVQTAQCICSNTSTADQRQCNWSCPIGNNGVPCTVPNACSFSGGSFTCFCPASRNGIACETAGNGLLGLVESILYKSTATLITDFQSNVYSFFNQEPRCEDNPAYCQGSQVFTANDNPVFPFYLDNIWSISANICVNNLDATFDSQTWVGAKFLNKKLQVPCELYRETIDNILQPVYTLTGKFRPHPDVPPSLHNKIFYTRCPNPTQILNSRGQFSKQQPLVQTASDGSILFDIVYALGTASGLTRIAEICA